MRQNGSTLVLTGWGLGALRLAPECTPLLRAYHWPGNVRELKHVISRAVVPARHCRETRLGIE